MKVVVVGPPKSGKSVFTQAMIEIIQERLVNRNAFRWMTLDLWDNALGWFRGEPRRRETPPSDEEVEKRARDFANLDSSLVLADGPGKIDEHTRKLVGPADALIIVSRSSSGITEWSGFAARSNLSIFAVFTTVQKHSNEMPEWNASKRQGKLRGLESDIIKDGGYRSLPEDTVSVIETFVRYLLDNSL